MVQMTFEGFLPHTNPQSETIQTSKTSAATSSKAEAIVGQTELVDVSDTAHEVGITHKMAVTIELYDRLQRCYPNDPYKNDAVLWEILWLANFERTLNDPDPIFAFIAAIPCASGDQENARLRYREGDPAILEMTG